MNVEQYKFRIAFISIISNTLLVVLKLVIGMIMGSISVISEAIHSGIDIFAAIVATVGVKRSAEPADNKHPFGHGKYENMSGFVQAILIFFAGAWIMYESIHKLLNPSDVGAPGLGVFIMFISALVNLSVGLLLLSGARKTRSVALRADAWHCLTDVFTSIGVMAGLAAMWAAHRLFPSADVRWIDPVAAIVVALIIVKAAWDLTMESVHDLLDVSLPPEEIDAIKAFLVARHPIVLSYHHFRSRKSGTKRFVEFHIFVDPSMSVDSSHSLHHSIAKQIQEYLPDTEVMVHIEPDTGSTK
jgi:cation diffusion facilitator family transporter